MRTAYKVRVYPTAEQAAVLNRTFGCVRLVWNTVLAWRQARYRANPRHLERKARNLARYQRRMARKQRGSNNRAKARAKVARAHTKVRDARADFLHRTSTRLVHDHDLIVIEDLNVAGTVRNRSLARVISDCGWGEFRRQLE